MCILSRLIDFIEFLSKTKTALERAMVKRRINSMSLFKKISCVGVFLSVRAFLKSFIMLLNDMAFDVALETEELATDI